MYGNIGVQPGFQCAASSYGMPGANMGMAGFARPDAQNQNMVGRRGVNFGSGMPLLNAPAYDNLTPKGKPKDYKEGGQVVKFDTFHGTHDKLKALLFLQQFDAAFAGGNFTEASKIRKAATFLKTNALQWWNTLLNQGVVPSTWVQLKQIFAPAWITNTFEAHYMIGLALLQRNESSEAVKQLEKALELSRGGASDMVEIIWLEVAKAKYAEWQKAALPRQKKQMVLRQSCEYALKNDHEKALAQLESNQNNEGDVMIESPSEFVEIDKTAFEISKLRSSYVEQKQTLAEVFDKAAECDKPSELPEYLCCKITMDLYRDPVITPSGVTYERAVLLDHLDKVGKFDPLTRQPLDPNQLTSNLAVKEAVRSYLAEHGWAYNMN
ncbi:hypothetical protein L7F22_002640 [Adiantum nelumboides]|nr:hypothetical protein [Adiantum nelumboides]